MGDGEEQTRKAQVLLVDDDEGILLTMEMAIRELDVEATTARSGDAALDLLRNQQFDLVVSDHYMPGTAQGMDLLLFVRELPDPPMFILVTANGTINLAVKAMKAGAHDFLEKPFEMDELISRVNKALNTLELTKENQALRRTVESHYVFTEIICASKRFRDVLDVAQRAAEKTTPVLLLGESGTGKDLLARAIHLHGPRRRKNFIPVNCGAIPKDLMESEFFGHKKGSFTGAVQTRMGCFEEVDGGTIFLDEIGEMPLDLQVKLLRVLEEKKIRRVGENTERPVDFRIIAATNQDVAEMVAQKRFRQDLFYRINVLTLEIPPLRDRPEDIVPLAEHYLRKARVEMESMVKGFTPAALMLLQAYSFPGNIRELINILQRAILLCDGDFIEPRHLPADLQDEPAETDFGSETFDLKEETRKAQERVEQRLIQRALRTTKFNHKKAAELLGISRGSLYSKLERIPVNN